MLMTTWTVSRLLLYESIPLPLLEKIILFLLWVAGHNPYTDVGILTLNFYPLTLLGFLEVSIKTMQVANN